MIFGYMNYVRHPDNKAWRVFVYRSKEVGEWVAARVAQAGIWYLYESAPKQDDVWMLIIKKEDFDAVFAHNAEVMSQNRPPLIPDSILRKMLITIFLMALILALLGAYFSNIEMAETTTSCLNPLYVVLGR
jgi:hypothetical protein